MFIDFQGLICFDLETTSSHRSLDEMGSENHRMVDLWQRLCEKRRKAGDERFLECQSDDEAYFNNAGLYPEFGRIVNASFGAVQTDSDEGERTIKVMSIGGEDEAEIVRMCNTVFSKSAWVAGHNVKGFDIPFFSRRAYINSMLPSQNIDVVTKKPWDVRIIDTQEVWKFGSFSHSYTSLDLLTTSLGLESPKLEHFGAHVSSLFWVEKDFEEIARYCEGDVVSTLKVLLKFNDPSIDVSILPLKRRPLVSP
jgi:hypothetical protein